MILGKYSFGLGDRFGRQGRALLAAVVEAKRAGLEVTPVWNKSHREHTIVGTRPGQVRLEADGAVDALGWEGAYFVDADHIGPGTVEGFIESSDFFTLDVAEYIGVSAGQEQIEAFMARHAALTGPLRIEGIGRELEISEPLMRAVGRKYLRAVEQAGGIYRRIASAKGAGNFITEVSMDETDQPQRPGELLLILAAIADEGIPVQMVAPRFTGRFNKGVDYAGSVERFAEEFAEDVAVCGFAAKEFGLPAGLKLSVHSGSDKFSLYGPINEILKRLDAGVHVKTAGTTWLEELAGLALAEGEGLELAKRIYSGAFERIEELCEPYSSVIEIDRAGLPDPGQVQGWDGRRFASALRHDRSCADYNPDFRQLLHVAYRIAAEMGGEFLDAVDRYEGIIAPGVTENIYARHIKPIFG